MKNDVFGKAIQQFHLTEDDSLEIEVFSELAGDEAIPVIHFFRELEEMPLIEQKALELASGICLDVGAGSGAHALVLQEKGIDVIALERSTLACDVMEERGVENVLEMDFYEFKNQKFDTILLLMNGIGIARSMEYLEKFLLHCKSLLTPNGKILLDSSDIIYMYEDEEGAYTIDLNGEYYGNMHYTIQFEEHKQEFDWLYCSFDLLSDACEKVGLKAKKLMDGEHFDYLAEVKVGL